MNFRNRMDRRELKLILVQEVSAKLRMAQLFMYVVDRDFGFAPNPFHGKCTLATCKPKLRKSAEIGDWVIGVGGGRLKASGKCIFAMRVTEKLTFNDYWLNPVFHDKRPIRNGSKKMMVGDNIYHRDPGRQVWTQADSHHSNEDGSVNEHNLANDTQVDAVLVSNHFYYFGQAAPDLPPPIVKALGYKNKRGYRRFDLEGPARLLVDWLEEECKSLLNLVAGDPFDFSNSSARYSVATNRVTD
ncbi:hypothetical protein [Roseimicrobium gellanilyticum]